jgi:magnesium-transporting ATPase (P-type)
MERILFHEGAILSPRVEILSVMNSLSAKPGPASPSPGLTAAEVATRLSQFGPNAVREERPHPVRQFLERFWAPIPWLLEATIIIQLFFGEQVMRDHVRLLGSVFVRVCGAGKRTV